MTAIALSPGRPRPLLALDRQKLLFSLSSFLAGAATLGIAFFASLPRPWWAILTVYVTAQPMAGAFRPKLVYRLAGIAIGAVVTVALVPNLQNSPMLLVLCLAAWTGFCIYIAVLDRTPRAFLFQMAAFSAAVISFPYMDDPADIFATTVARVEEMCVALACVTLVHALLQPWTAAPVIRGRAERFLCDAGRWTGEALGSRHTPLEQEHRRQLAADVTELGMIAVHLPFDQRGVAATRRAVLTLQERLAQMLPLASAAANRLDLLREHGPLEPDLARLVDDGAAWLGAPEPATGAGAALLARCRELAQGYAQRQDWPGLLALSACERMAEFVEAHRESRQLVRRLGGAPVAGEEASGSGAPPRFALARDHRIAALAGLATGVAIILYCTVWILLAWPSGSATAAFAALITCSFAMQDDPAPTIGRYLGATLSTFPLAALYLFVILPRVDGYAMLVITLAPALLWMGYVQADPARSARALPMFSCFIVAMGFTDRFQPDFAVFINTGLAQVGGIVTTLVVTRLFRSTDARWAAHRTLRDNWRDIVALADIRRHADPARWTAQATDRLGQVAARMAFAAPGDALHAADGLADLRIGRNIPPIRRALARVPHDARARLGAVLAGVAALFRKRQRTGEALPAPPELLHALDGAIAALLPLERAGEPYRALLALVGMRCNLFPAAEPFRP